MVDWKRHALIISSTAPAFFVLAIVFAFRWVLIGGEKANDVLTTAISFTLLGSVLLLVNIAVRRDLEQNE